MMDGRAGEVAVSSLVHVTHHFNGARHLTYQHVAVNTLMYIISFSSHHSFSSPAVAPRSPLRVSSGVVVVAGDAVLASIPRYSLPGTHYVA